MSIEFSFAECTGARKKSKNIQYQLEAKRVEKAIKKQLTSLSKELVLPNLSVND